MAKQNSQTATSKTAPSSAVVCPFMSFEEVLAMTGYKNRPTLYAQIANGFPAPVALGPLRSNGRASKVAWVRAEVEQWIADVIAAPRHLDRKSQVQSA
ncbi:AlpA family phage regulatory protein [Pseudomonas sp. A2]|uniref:helix-turn-helix transcriptional regulator n=1 Tax=Pseudomonas sp. A2 TaxID=107445 RepID=UPI001FFF4300|nr:AlpA family phage regulatory protein [Pseudomonas sp. A2]